MIGKYIPNIIELKCKCISRYIYFFSIIFSREHTELEESRKILHANNLSVEDHRRSGGLESSGSLSPSLGRPNSRGRSVSVIHPGQGSPTNTLGAALV